ncbi:uncharacterized protein PG998_008184 [Apiospora kogelbergensis]|uniref:Polyketide cyclase / dehydrase and lipid transport n=1 Tax=Apiospora kogelbergensis TaxID=1337665 RepID=A0AAW0QFD0_9PEZI
MWTHQIEESTLIAAPPSEVWAVLTDLASWSDWNSFVIKAEVQPPHEHLAVGSHQLLTLAAAHAERPPSVYGNVASVLEPPAGQHAGELRWGGQWLHALVLDTKHWCLLATETGDRGQELTLFTQGELFTGVIVPVARAMGFFDELQAGYVRMNEDLRRRAEEGVGGSGSM